LSDWAACTRGDAISNREKIMRLAEGIIFERYVIYGVCGVVKRTISELGILKVELDWIQHHDK
jgi:hypothetical protein